MNSARIFAGATTSSYDMTSAVGPTNLSATCSTVRALGGARWRGCSSRRGTPPWLRGSFLRSSVTVATSSPLGSATMAVLALAILAWSSSMTASFSVRFKCSHLLPDRPRAARRDVGHGPDVRYVDPLAKQGTLQSQVPVSAGRARAPAWPPFPFRLLALGDGRARCLGPGIARRRHAAGPASERAAPILPCRGRELGRVDLDARAHGRGDGDVLEVDALGGLRLAP